MGKNVTFAGIAGQDCRLHCVMSGTDAETGIVRCARPVPKSDCILYESLSSSVANMRTYICEPGMRVGEYIIERFIAGPWWGRRLGAGPSDRYFS